MSKHGPDQHQEGLSRTRRPTHRPREVCPGLQWGTLQQQANQHYYGEVTHGVVGEREKGSWPMDRGYLKR